MRAGLQNFGVLQERVAAGRNAGRNQVSLDTGVHEVLKEALGLFGVLTVRGNAKPPNGTGSGGVGFPALFRRAGEYDVGRGALRGGRVPVGADKARGGLAAVNGLDKLGIGEGFPGGGQFEEEVDRVLKLLGVNGRLLVVVDKPAVETPQNRQKVERDPLFVGLVVHETDFPALFGGLADGQQVLQVLYSVGGAVGGNQGLLVTEQNRGVPVPRREGVRASVGADV